VSGKKKSGVGGWIGVIVFLAFVVLFAIGVLSQ